MTKLNGREVLQTEDGAPGLGKIPKGLIDAACNRFFLSRGISRLDPAGYQRAAVRRRKGTAK